MEIKTAKELAERCRYIANNHKTLYVMGCFGAPMTSSNKTRYTSNHSYNRGSVRTQKIKSASSDTFGFDCVGLIKGILWGWGGIALSSYGGATYKSNDVPDINADTMISICKDVSSDFSSIEIGEVVWMKGHIGVYVEDGLVVECTPSWKDGVQITAILNLGRKSEYNGRTWLKHGKLPYVQYTQIDTITIILPVLRKGSRDSHVRTLQQLLVSKGYALTKYGIDGHFGAETESALKKYQSDSRMSLVDGVAGKETWSVILK